MHSGKDAFSALVLTQENGSVNGGIRPLTVNDLPSGDVLVEVSHSSLNYKDGLILNGLGRLVRNYPHVPGIDLAGTVIESATPSFKAGDEVLLTGWRVGETHWGGFSQMARVKSDWLVEKPAGLSAAQAMAFGTAGFTAMLAVMALERHGLTPSSGEVLVTGAAGGVGSVATSLLASLGYNVVVATGRPELTSYLESLGAKTIIPRDQIAGPASKPLDTERWAAAIDSVGGSTLATVLTQMRYRGSVAACGLAGGDKLATTVIPFLLRGVNVLGIDSVMSPPEERRTAWQRLAKDFPLQKLEALTTTIKLDQLIEKADRILAGGIRGRCVVDLRS